jgi:hypothetical protein
MTKKKLAARYPGAPEWAIRKLLPVFNCYEGGKKSAKRAAKDGVVGLWLP